MQKLKQIDVDKLENFISEISNIITDCDSVVFESNLSKARLGYYIGQISRDLYHKIQQVQDVLDQIHDNDLVEIPVYNNSI